jgi:hypothetical protein
MIVIHVSGVPGSGKTTLGEKIAKARPDIRVIDTDDLLRPNTPQTDELARLEQELPPGDAKYVARWREIFTGEINGAVSAAAKDDIKVLVFVGLLDHWGGPSATPLLIDQTSYRFYIDIPLPQLLRQFYTRICKLYTTEADWTDVANAKYGAIPGSDQIIQGAAKTKQWHTANGYKPMLADDIFNLVLSISPPTMPLNSNLCAGCGSTPHRANSGFCSDGCALNFGQAMQDHAHLSVAGMIKLPTSSPINEALKSVGYGNRVLPERVVYSLGARLYYVGGKQGKGAKKESKNKRAKTKAEARIMEVTDAAIAREIAEAALRRADELEKAAATSSSSAPHAAARPVLPSQFAESSSSSVPYVQPTLKELAEQELAQLAELRRKEMAEQELQRRAEQERKEMAEQELQRRADKLWEEHKLKQQAEEYMRQAEQQSFRRANINPELEEMAEQAERRRAEQEKKLWAEQELKLLTEQQTPPRRAVRRPIVANPNTLHYIRTLPISGLYDATIVFDTSGDLIVSAGDGRFGLFSSDNGRLIKAYPTTHGHNYRRDALCMSTQGVLYTSDTNNNMLEARRSSDGALLNTAKCQSPTKLALNSDGTNLYVVSEATKVLVFDVSQLTHVDTITFKDISTFIRDICVLSNGAIILSLRDDENNRQLVTLSSDYRAILRKVALPNSFRDAELLVDGNNVVFVLTIEESKIFIFDTTTSAVLTWNASVPGIDLFPLGLLLHPSGEVGIQSGSVYMFSSAVVSTSSSALPPAPAAMSSSSSLSMPPALPPVPRRAVPRSVIANPKGLHFVRKLSLPVQIADPRRFDPHGKPVALDPRGNVLVFTDDKRLVLLAGTDGHVMREYTHTKMDETGNRLLVNSQGFIFHAKRAENKIYVLSADDVLISIIEAGAPAAMALNANETVLYASWYNNQIEAYDISTLQSPRSVERFYAPRGTDIIVHSIGVLSDETLVVLIQDRRSMFKSKSVYLVPKRDREYSARISLEADQNIVGIVVDGNNNIVVCSTDEDKNYVIDKDGNTPVKWKTNAPGSWTIPEFLLLNPVGELAVVGRGSQMFFYSSQ